MDHLKKTRKKIHPKEKNGIVSNIFFLYVVNLFKKGYRKDLEESDLYEVLSDYRSQKLGDQLETEWEKQKENCTNSSIIRLLWKYNRFLLLRIGITMLFKDTAELTIQPYALGKFISYFSSGQTNITKTEAYLYGIFLISFQFLQCICRHNYLLAYTGLGIRIRTAFCSFIYRKALKLNPAYLRNISIGKIVTIITKDVQSFEGYVDFANDVWVSIVKSTVVFCMLYYRIGIAALTGLVFFLITISLQIYLGLKITSMKIHMCEKTDERLQITQETLSSIKIIKMYTWENIFSTRIAIARKKEVNAIYNIYFVQSLILVIGSLNSYITFYILLMTYIKLGNPITAEIVYFIMSTFQGLSSGLSIYLPISIYQTAELLAAIKRIRSILTATEVQPEEQEAEASVVKIKLNHVTVKINNKEILEDVNLTFGRGLTVVSGSVGSGKTFLLKTILREYRSEGTLTVSGAVSYASQEPWLFPSSIRQNILFGEKFYEKRYHEVLKVCALIYDFELLEEGDNTIVEDRGINLSKGQQARINLARAIYKQSDIYLLDDSLATLDTHVSAYIFEECIRKFLRGKLVILVTHSIKYFHYADKIIIMDKGKIKRNSKLSELKEIEIVGANQGYQQKTISGITNFDEETSEESKLITGTATEKKVYHEYKKSGKVDFKVYKKYVKMGGFCIFLIVFVVFASVQLSTSYTDKLISAWVNLEEKISNFTIGNSTNITIKAEQLGQERNQILYLYTATTVVTTLSTLGRAFALLFFSRRASIRLHKSMITHIINATMQFFDTNFIGNMLNRFSKDMQAVDEAVPSQLYQVFSVVLMLTGIIALITSVNVMFLLLAAVFLAVLVMLRQYCVRTSRCLKRLDALTKSPVVGHFNATLEGLTTIRAFKTEKILKEEFDQRQDLYTSAAFILQSSMRAFAFVLEMLCGFFLAMIIIRLLIYKNDTLTGDVGLAITQAFLLSGNFQWIIHVWTTFENQMTSVERVSEYTTINQENNKGVELEHWPQYGEIKFEDVNLSYRSLGELVLRNINFTVKPLEKIGIVGRTGAGKSSIISALFRLYEIKGKITIDGLDIKTLSLDFLRSNISIISQDPVLFSGTIRDNIDPAKKYSDDEIWTAVKIANLQTLVPSLDLKIIEGGSNFSVGQRQLICLARAVIRKNRIVVLDEATANMDLATDALIHQSIEQNFASCTVFIIAHKLHSVMNCSKVMVLDKGEIAEFDKPDNLLQNINGSFYKMVVNAGLLNKVK